MAVPCTLSVSFRGGIILNRLQIIAFQIYRNITKYQCYATSSQILGLVRHYLLLGRFFGGYGSSTHEGSEFVDDGIF